MLKELKFNINANLNSVNIDELNECYDNVCVLDSNSEFNDGKNLRYSKLIAIGATQELKLTHVEDSFSRLRKFYEEREGWIFGYFTYDFKNKIEQLKSDNDDGLGFPEVYFFSPKVVLQIIENTVSVSYDEDFISQSEAEAIYNLAFSNQKENKQENILDVSIQSKITKDEYIAAVNQLKQHIQRGDIYEINFCQEFFAEKTIINTVEVFNKLNEISRAPFSAYCKFNNHYLMCASPERFLQKRGNRLISQPIKGTIKRSLDKQEDDQLKLKLKNDEKERSENVMIVDLVRNDLSKIAKRRSVNVDELFGVYSFKQVHQLISTISCDVNDDCDFAEIIKSTFPMGSMTGAPKVSAMKLIEQYESTKRGLYSGAVGYINPEGDFDFNVVIRSILYNAENKYLSFMVGSAITDKADAEKEYEECLLKAKAMFEVLGG